ncbi:hypothetical protein EVAR_36024_1 [Eumeta japonica]|uniref:Uncharacterized protein n=1 Tax=Eumeta variegata TaxID=151549 RepID=A0A4C1WU44_EUMVA|nr:hypothetical protein EVAR_36024_1 [Eumeta japonica]
MLAGDGGSVSSACRRPTPVTAVCGRLNSCRVPEKSCLSPRGSDVLMQGYRCWESDDVIRMKSLVAETQLDSEKKLKSKRGRLLECIQGNLQVLDKLNP